MNPARTDYREVQIKEKAQEAWKRQLFEYMGITSSTCRTFYKAKLNNKKMPEFCEQRKCDGNLNGCKVGMPLENAVVTRSISLR